MKLNKIVIFRVVFKGFVVGCFVRDVPARVLALAMNDLAPNFIELHTMGRDAFPWGFVLVYISVSKHLVKPIGVSSFLSCVVPYLSGWWFQILQLTWSVRQIVTNGFKYF